MSTLKQSIGVLAVLSGSLVPAHSNANLLTNGSFEVATNLAPNSTLAPGATNLVGWTIVGSGNLIWCDSGFYCAKPAFDGVYSLDLTGLTNSPPYAGVAQIVTTLPGQVYDLSFALAGRTNNVPVSVEVHAGSVSQVFTNPTAAWVTQSLSFTASGAQTEIRIIGSVAGGQGLTIQLDDVSLAAIPEPITPALFLSGLLLIAHRLRTKSAVHRL